MNRSNTTAATSGIGLNGLVFVLFLGLKLAGIEPVASWSWWWVTAPLWAGIAFLGIVLLVIFVASVLIELRGPRRLTIHR